MRELHVVYKCMVHDEYVMAAANLGVKPIPLVSWKKNESASRKRGEGGKETVLIEPGRHGT